MKIDRRDFVKKATLAGVGTATLSSGAMAGSGEETQARQRRQRSTMNNIRLGFIGVGNRGSSHVRNSMNVGSADIVAICDINENSLASASEMITGRDRPAPTIYTGSDFAYLDMLEKENLDAVIISTPWEWHGRMAVAAMKAGAYTGLEVPACVTLDECWDLVNTHEATGTELFFLENRNFRRNLMALLNMVRQDVFGELLHCRCAYLHDLRGVKFNDGEEYNYRPGRPLKFGKDAYAEAKWRGLHSIRRNGDLYPTHSIGPIAKLLDINNGNQFLSLSAFASKARGLEKFVKDHGGENHPLSKTQWNCGDIVTSTINCANGETVIVTHDTNNPRPKDDDYIVQGTKGLWYGDWKSIYIENVSPGNRYEDEDPWVQKYDHKYWREMEERAEGSGHHGTDYILLYEFIDLVKNRKKSTLDVYDAASWSAISHLSEMSISKGGMPVDFPDFTRGQWVKFKYDKAFAIDDDFPYAVDRIFEY